MICVVIKGPTLKEAYRQISEALPYADLVELRLDHFVKIEMEEIERLRSEFSIPMIFTLRSQQQGGSYQGSEEERLAKIRRLVELRPEYLDLESDVAFSFIEEVALRYPDVKLIISYHNFTDTPEDLEGLYREMQKVPAFFYKIAVTPHNSLDALRLVSWVKKSNGRLIAISMGAYGQISRILAPVLGCPITYTTMEEGDNIPLGQLSAKILCERFHYRSLNPQTALYGLIGDPVDKSISDVTHNGYFAASGLNAVYVKIQVKPSELSEFLRYAKELSFQGISVTMPLKEHILSHLDFIDPQAREIGAVNTLLFENERISGFNTDGIGALNALEQELSVKGKRIVMIGAGGACLAIAYEALRRGGLVTILNRNAEKAMQVAQRLGCRGKGLECMAECAKEGYDILINGTPVAMPISVETIIPGTVVMDIKTKPKDTELLQEAVKKNCHVIYGYRMFVEQAVAQYQLWFKGKIDARECRNILEHQASNCLY